jgi:hydrogenase maturation factor
MAFFSFSCQKSFFYLLGFWIIDFLISMHRMIYLPGEISSIESMKKSEFIYINLKTVSDLCAGFLILHTYIRMKKINQKEEQKTVEKVKSILSRKNKYMLIFLISLLEFICRSTDFFYLIIIKKFTIRAGEIAWLISVDFFARIFISRRVLKFRLFRHHYFSIVLIILGFFSMSICAFESISEYELNNWPYFIFIIIKNILLPLEDVYNKILLTDKFLLPHYLMFWRGLFNCIFLTLLGLCIIVPGVIEYNFNTPDEMNSNITIFLLHKIIFIIFSFCRAFIYLKVVDIFSPQHVAFCNAAFYLYLLILCRCKNDKSILILIIDIFSLIVIIFATLIFNELIIINAFGFNQNTKKGFIKKEMLELQNINSLENHEDEEDSEENEENSDSKRETLNENDNRQSTINGNIGDFDGSTNASINNTEMSINDINDNNNKDIN